MAEKRKQRHSGANQPRDADITSGQTVQKFADKAGNVRNDRNSFYNSGKKTAAQDGQSGQKKRVQKGKFQRESSFAENGGNKPDAGNTDGKVKDSFEKEGNVFAENGADKISGQTVQKLGNKPERTQIKESGFQNSREKTDGQTAGNSRQKKQIQKGKFQKESSFAKRGEKAENSSPTVVPENNSFQEKDDFYGESGEEQGGTFTEKDGYRKKDTYRQSEKKRRYRRRQNREHKAKGSRENTDFRRDFQTKDTAFTEDASFTEGAEPEFQGSRKLERMQKKAERAGKRTEQARQKLPKAKEYSFERVFDEKTGRTKYVLTARVKEKPFKQENPVRTLVGKAGRSPSGFAHGKVAEVEKENSAVEGAHKTEQKTEDIYRFVKRSHKSRAQRKREKVARFEKKQEKAEIRFRYQKFLEENPKMKEKTLKKHLQKRLQKQRIKREYAKAKRSGKAAKETAAKSANFTATVARKLQEMAAKHASVLIAVFALAAVLVMLMVSISSCGAMFPESMGAMLAGSYMSAPAEIDAADLVFSKLEMDLQKKINSIETDYPDYDEYRYNLDAIGHDPFALISYLSAVHTEFTAADVQGEIESLFDEMYELAITPVTETRTRTVTKTGTRTVTDPETGEETEEEYEYEEEEEYTVTILEVTLTAADLNTVVAGHMDDGQKEIYALYNETHGLTQQFYTPLNLYWYNYVSSYYGYRINQSTGEEQIHRGVDIAVPTGTAVLAAMDGTVTTAAYDSYYGNYVVIENDGYCTKYAHMDTLAVSTGQGVKHGDSIGTTGNTGSSTGSHLHIECMYNGEYYNPLFYFEAGEGTLYGETHVPGSGGGNAIPPDAYDDASVQALMEEATKYLGYPYVWGGSSPSTSFDCSGFVCWVFTNSGVHSLPRTTAQGIYDQCTPVSAADAKAGDIIFFTGTYNSAGAVSHVGIYCGNGVMIHCGDPIKYASINTPYWQSHFYSFGRLN